MRLTSAFRFDVDGSLSIDDADAAAEHAQVNAHAPFLDDSKSATWRGGENMARAHTCCSCLKLTFRMIRFTLSCRLVSNCPIESMRSSSS
jgi:hypothetical protein